MLLRISSKIHSLLSDWRLRRSARDVAAKARPTGLPVVFFNASARLGLVSQNAAFALLAAWGLRLEGVRVVHFVCRSGMSRCVLGTDPDRPDKAPDCQACVARSEHLYAGAPVHWFGYQEPSSIASDIQHFSLEQLEAYHYADIPLGQLTLPGLRWALRCHHLQDDEPTRFLFRQYILSAYNVALEFEQFLNEVQPLAVVLFNGVMYPEAVAAWLARRRGIRTITHEVGLQPLTAFFTLGEATAYPMDIPSDFQLSPAQDEQLDEYLSQRFQGRFSMAGVQFWPEMQELDETLLSKMAAFDKVVPVFTNVIFDTSQIHANALFADMFAWLDELLNLMRANPATLFVLRAHPDEMRANKRSRQSVASWFEANQVSQLPNVIFIDATQYLSSYALIHRSHFVMVYNSSIGLEASILGKAVLSAGASRYTHFPTVFFPRTAADYWRRAAEFLAADRVDQPAALQAEARRVLYFQLFRTALPFGHFLEAYAPGLVHFKDIALEDLRASRSPAIAAIKAGVINEGPFLV